MADETLRRNLEAAFDPGPDFPNSLLLSRTMAAVNVEAGSAAGGMNRRSRGQDSPAWMRPGLRITAILVAVVVAVAAAAAFLAVQKFFSPVPAQPRPGAVSRSCSQGNLHMVTSSVSWNGTSRTTDGGVSWRDVSPPWLPNETEGGRVACYLDANHVWMTEVVGASETTTGQLVVFETRNGGLTWQESNPVPIGESNPLGVAGLRPFIQLQFIDARHGWLLTDSGLYGPMGATTNIYSTVDGGLHWSQVATSEDRMGPGGYTAGSSWLQEESSCRPSGMTFISLDQGWLTWDCITQSFFSQTTFVALATNDGGRSWAPSQLKIGQNLSGLPDGPGPNVFWTCGASPPTFSGSQGVLPVSCAVLNYQNRSATGAGWSATVRTSDAGSTWNVDPSPAYVGLSQLDFVDSNTGFMFVKRASGNDLYRTTNAGRDWTLVTGGLFSGQNVTNFQFIGATGFAYTDRSPGAAWKTTDGGRTWVPPSP